MAPAAPARIGDGPASKSLAERVGQLYYAYGLFCASHPVAFISLACTVVVFCCYPLLNLPLPGNVPQQHASLSGNLSKTEASSVPVWFSGPPLCYIQQVILKSAVSPWTEKLILTDAFRGPLSEAFSLLENIRNYQHDNSSLSLSHVCLHVEAVKSRHVTDQKHILPEYNCLVLSPANLWHQNFQEFQKDPNLLSTIFTNINIQRSKISLAEISFGMRLKDTGIKRYPLRTRQRTLQYAVTLILQKHDKEYVEGLRKRLSALYPLYRDNGGCVGSGSELHVFYPGEFHWRQLIPLTIMYLMSFLYVYFSARKVELLGSKVGMAFSAVMTALAAWLMSTGLCCFFGLNLTVSWRESYPYLAMAVGLENVIVISKSVLLTPPHLDVKIRVAQGLCKEGWSITYNLLTEVTILTFGLFTFVPAIQRFCVFAIFGILADFFLQMSFISPVLGVVTKREEKTIYRHSNMSVNPMHAQQPLSTHGTILRSKSHPRLNGLVTQPPERFPTMVVAPVHYAGRVLNKLPKRIRLVHFWARTRFFQRSFMIFMVTWIAMIACNSDVIESFLQMDVSDREWDKAASSSGWSFEQPQQYLATPSSVLKGRNLSVSAPTKGLPEEDMTKLRPNQCDSWDRVSTYHWAAILSLYNISASGRYVTVLPPIHLAHTISPDEALRLRNPEEKAVERFHWDTLAAALDPLDFSDGSPGQAAGGSAGARVVAELPLTPSSPTELFLISVLCVVSVAVLAYFMVLLYRCVCSRNYAEWRAGWLGDHESNDAGAETEVVLQAVPLMLEGHPQEVECLASDGGIVVSTCLAGQLRSWDAISGESLAVVDRKSYFANSKPEGEIEDTVGSDFELRYSPSYEDECTGLHSRFANRYVTRKDKTLLNGIARHSRRSDSWTFPDLRPSINTNFSSLSSSLSSSQKLTPPADDSKAGFDFGSQYRELYKLHHLSSDLSGASDDLEDQGDEGDNLLVPGKSILEERKRSMEDVEGSSVVVPPIWCVDCRENLVVLGCADGRLEFWEGSSGRLKCIYEDPSSNPSGVTAVKLVGNRVVAARLSGFIDFFILESYSRGRQIDWGFTAYRRSHVRSGSAGSLDWDALVSRGEEEDIRCVRMHTTRAHQQPISALHTEGGRVLTGSQDHTLKVFRLEDHLPLYTLHGHCGPITCLFIDRVSPMTAGSGSQDGLLCVWDLLTGACMYSNQAHDGAVLSLTYSASYVISLGADDRLCVWERFQGHLLNTIQMVGQPHLGQVQAYCSSIVMLTHSLLLTSKQGSLVVWDVRAGEPVRMVRLGHADSCVFIKQLHLMRDGVVCDYANQLRIVRFPLATDKTE